MFRRAIMMTVAGAVVLSMTTELMAQEPRQGRRGGFGGGFGGPGGFPVSSLMLLQAPEVRTELAVTPEQGQKIDALATESREKLRASFGGGSREEFQALSPEEREKRMAEGRKKMEESGKETDAKLATILDAKQQQRLKELRLQREGVGALGKPEVAKELGLSQEQNDKIHKIQEDARPDFGALAGLREAPEEQRTKVIAEMRAKREKADADILGVLTAEQKTKFEAMKGKAFNFPAGGAGGFGGAGGGAPGAPGAPGGERRRPAPKQEQ